MVELYARHQQAAGHNVTIITHGHRKKSGQNRSNNELNIVRNPGIPLGKTGYHWPLRMSAEGRKVLAMADIVHAHHLFLCIHPAAKFSTAPIVYTNHTRYDLYAAVYNPLRRTKTLPETPPRPAAAIMGRAWPRQTEACQTIIAPSPEIKAVMRSFGVTRPITVIPNGIETERFHPPSNRLQKEDLGCQPEDIVAMYVGRLAIEKEIGTLLDAFKIAAGREPRLRLVLVGPGPLRPVIQNQIKAEEIGHQIKLLDPQPSEKVPALLGAADFFVTASRSEVHPLTLLEAIAAGLPVVVPDSEPLRRWVEPPSGSVGLIARTKSAETAVEALARQMVSMGADKAQRNRFSQNCAVLLPKIDIRRTISATEALYFALKVQNSHGKDQLTSS